MLVALVVVAACSKAGRGPVAITTAIVVVIVHVLIRLRGLPSATIAWRRVDRIHLVVLHSLLIGTENLVEVKLDRLLLLVTEHFLQQSLGE